MIQERNVGEPTNVVIWSASGLLATVLGLGSAFVLWLALHQSTEVGVVTASVFTLGIGLAFVGLASPRRLMRIFLVVFAVALVAGFMLGSPSFAMLAA